jgi:peptidoglycan hydrolase CwlO-like protein
MKKKFFQILLMGAVTVSMGMFVSCKDTNADMYKQLELKIDENSKLDDVVNAKLQQLEALQQQLEKKIALIKPCNCPENMSQTIQELVDFMNKVNEAAATGDDKSLETLKGLVQGIIENYQTINNFFNNIGVSEAELQAAVDMLNARIDAIKQCECDLTKLAQIEQTAQQALALAQQANTKVEEAMQLAQSAKTAAEQATAKLEEAISKAGAAQTAADEAKELANSLKTIAEAADALSKENKEKIENNTQAINNINLQLTSMSTDLQNATTKANEAYAQAFTNKTAIETLSTTVEANKAALETLTTTTVPGLQTEINNLKEKVNGMAEDIENLKPEITKLYEYADATLEKAKAYTDLEVALVRADLNGLDLKVFNLGEDLNGAVEDIEALKTAVQQVNTAIAGLDTRISENTTKIGQLETNIENVKTELEGKIGNLQTEIDDLTEDVKKNTENIEKLTGLLDLLQENLKRQVTGIIVQETYNPAYGTFKVPAAVQSNVLLAYYGEAYKNVEFPTNSTLNYVDEKYALSTKDMQMLELLNKEPLFSAKSGDVIMQNEENNAGTLYLTVNPNTVDFSKLQLSLVNSQDHPSYIKLGTLQRSDKILQLGFSRAADNGFYECTANLSPEDINKVQKVDFNTSSLKDAINEIINNRTSADFSKIASDMAEVIKGLRIDATAVKCEWEDAAKEGETAQKHAVYSNYNLAATAIKPLSLQTAKDFHYQTIPGYEKAMDLLDSISRELHGAVKTAYKELNESDLINHVSNLKINKVTVADLTEAQLALFKVDIDTTIEIGGLSYHLDLSKTVDVPIKFKKDINLDIDENATIDLSGVTVNTPTIVVSANIKNGEDNSAQLVVPVKDNNGTKIGEAKIDLDQIKVDANASMGGGTITLAGDAIAHFKYKDDFTIKVDTIYQTTVNIDQWIYFGDYKLDANGNIVYDENGKPVHTDKKSFHIWVRKDLSGAAESLWGSAQGAIGSVNDMLDDLNEIVDDANDMIAKINSYQSKIDTKIDDYMDKVASYLKKFNKKIVDFVNNTNARLQPLLIASDGTGTKFLSEAKNYPTVMGSDISLVPTSWNLELLVPYAKKHVAITNVIKDNKSAKGGDSGCLSELRRANSSTATLNTIIPGNERRAYATGLKSGYTYEIAYSALDFHGKMATRKYYIRIK